MSIMSEQCYLNFISSYSTVFFVILEYNLCRYVIKNASIIPFIYAVKTIRMSKVATTIHWNRAFEEKSKKLAPHNIQIGIPTTIRTFIINLIYKSKLIITNFIVNPIFCKASFVLCFMASK